MSLDVDPLLLSGIERVLSEIIVFCSFKTLVPFAVEMYSYKMVACLRVSLVTKSCNTSFGGYSKKATAASV